MKPVDVTLLGKGDLAIRAAAWFADSPRHRLACVVPVIPEPAWTGSLAGWARDRGVTVVESGDFRDHPPGRIGLALSIFYDRIVDAAFIGRCDRILNLHNGPLPRYRGVRSINWALKNGETSHGVTLHEITAGIDDGPIVAQVVYPVHPDIDEVADVYARANAFAWTLLEQTLPLLPRLAGRPQDESRATYFSADDDAALGERLALRRG